MNPTNKKDLLLDFSGLSLLDCDRKYQAACVKGLHQNSYYLQVGKAAHRILELTFSGEDKFKVLEYATGLPNTLDKARPKLSALALQAKDLYPCRPLYTEYKFAIQVGTIADVNVVLCGTTDLIIQEGDGLTLIDFKTTHAFKTNAKVKEYEATMQLLLYLYALKQIKQELPEEVQQLMSRRLKARYAVLSLTQPNLEFVESSDIYLTEAAEERIKTTLPSLIERAFRIHRMPGLAPAVGQWFKTCDYCPIKAQCLYGTDEDVAMAFISPAVKKYNPLTHSD